MGLLLLKLQAVGLDCKLVYILGETDGSGQVPPANI